MKLVLIFRGNLPKANQPQLLAWCFNSTGGKIGMLGQKALIRVCSEINSPAPGLPVDAHQCYFVPAMDCTYLLLSMHRYCLLHFARSFIGARPQAFHRAFTLLLPQLAKSFSSLGRVLSLYRKPRTRAEHGLLPFCEDWSYYFWNRFVGAGEQPDIRSHVMTRQEETPSMRAKPGFCLLS